MRFSTFAILIVASLAAAACTKIDPCAGWNIRAVTFTLVYPINHATSVPDSPQSFVFQTGPGGKLSGLQLVLFPPSGPPIVVDPGPVPSPLPTPHESPVPNAILAGFPVPTLAPATTYQMGFKGTDTVGGMCPGTFGISGGGNFTTQ